MLYSNKDLRKLIIPLVIEQVLIIAVGMADTMMISTVGEAAVSGVSLVDTVNILIIGVFTAMATGGAVVVGHFLGQRDEENACKASWQLILFSGVTSIVVSVVFIAFHNLLLHAIFKSVSVEVMENAKTYLLITAVSIFPLAIYNACSALFRAMGNSTITMWISLGMNIVNVIGNAIFIYGFKIGTAGAATATTISRIAAAVVIFVLIYKKRHKIYVKGYVTWRFNKEYIKRILYIGIPNGLENSMFQLGKILLLSLVSTFGTYAIAANAVCNTIAMFNVLPGIAIGYAQLSVVSFCIGAGDIKQAKYYTKKLMILANIFMVVLSAVFIIGTQSILRLYNLSPETAVMAEEVLVYHAWMVMFFWVPSFCFSNSLRAAGDVVFPMGIAVFSMWIFRIGTAYFLSQYLDMGLMGVWIAMSIDWIFRGIAYFIRYITGGWLCKITNQKVIK